MSTSATLLALALMSSTVSFGAILYRGVLYSADTRSLYRGCGESASHLIDQVQMIDRVAARLSAGSFNKIVRKIEVTEQLIYGIEREGEYSVEEEQDYVTYRQELKSLHAERLKLLRSGASITRSA